MNSQDDAIMKLVDETDLEMSDIFDRVEDIKQLVNVDDQLFCISLIASEEGVDIGNVLEDDWKRLYRIMVEDLEYSIEEISAMVESKYEEYEGLVKRHKCTFMVAREEDVDVWDNLSERYEDVHPRSNDLRVKDLVPDMSRASITLTVDEVKSTNTFERDDDEEDGRVRNVMLKDDTGKTQLTLWGDSTELADKFEEGSDVRVEGSYTKPNDWLESQFGCGAELRVGKSTVITDVESGDVIVGPDNN